jgi:predicted RNA-binding protein YlqC (UPF0109 family)
VQNATLLVSASAAGALIGKQGTTAQELRERSGADISVRGGREGEQGVVNIRGSQAQVESGFDAVVGRLTTRRREGEEERRGEGGGGAPGAAESAGPFAGLVVDEGVDVIVTQVAVPTEFVGRLIGKSGVAIKEVRLETGCAVVVESDKAAERRVQLERAAFGGDGLPAADEAALGAWGSSVRVVTVSGSQPRVARAIDLLRDRLADAMVRSERP